MKFLKIFCVTLLCLAIPALSIKLYIQRADVGKHISAYFKTSPKGDAAINTAALRSGDIIFQTSQSAQSEAIQLVTHSPYSHCGIVYERNGKMYVFEAVQPVKLTPLNDWISRGKEAHYVVKRLKDADNILTADVLRKMQAEGEAMQGKNYDLQFGWNDDNIYCSELIWKIYKRAANVEIGELDSLKDFDLSNPAVVAKMKERYGSNIPWNEPVISPAAIYNSPLLRTVVEG